MPIVATIATPLPTTAEEVRSFMRDYPHKNILLDDVEFSELEILQAVKFVTSVYNVTTPLTTLPVGTWVDGHEYLLLLGISWYLVRSAAFSQARNQFTYQDGDIAPIGVDDKYTIYINLAQSLKQEWDELVKTSKIQMNLEGAYGGVSSGYRNIARNQYR